ncbi:MAG: formyltetrahydrofolate deformylase, partial [Burkholderiaceae bacterium]|nr:formyltetrahydrofolate deformylase [Burkholderiaceae bacterium]
MQDSVILTITCPDRVGIVAAVSTFLSQRDAFITEAQQYGDPVTGHFFMRWVFQRGAEPLDDLRQRFAAIAAEFHMDWQMHDGDKQPRLAILVSRFGHCLNDLLHRYHSATLGAEVPLVISNHEDMRSLVEWHGIDYHHLPVTAATKPHQEAQIEALLDRYQIELVVLARYMQVLSPGLSAKLAGRCINIHHSFLPSFKGAKPYQQAHERGVKLIGATAHYVTDHLDEGPIIDQEVQRVDHTHSVE